VEIGREPQLKGLLPPWNFDVSVDNGNRILQVLPTLTPCVS
jgi:hypothetical protein